MRLLDQFGRLRATPERHSDYYEHDSVGRRIEISIFASYAIHYWVDDADQHIKVLSIRAAGR